MKQLEIKLGKKLKKPVCAYSLFVKERRQLIHLSNPNLDHVEVMQQLSAEWQNLDTERK